MRVAVETKKRDEEPPLADLYYPLIETRKTKTNIQVEHNNKE